MGQGFKLSSLLIKPLFWHKWLEWFSYREKTMLVTDEQSSLLTLEGTVVILQYISVTVCSLWFSGLEPSTVIKEMASAQDEYFY